MHVILIAIGAVMEAAAAFVPGQPQVSLIAGGLAFFMVSFLPL